MEVRAGYKTTDVGVIPADWDVCSVADVVTSFQNGFAFASHGYVKSGMPIVTMAQIGLDGTFNFQSDAVNYWPLKAASALTDFQLICGDIIVAMTDVTPQKNLIGRMVQVTEEGPLLLNQRVGLLRVSADRIDPYFLRAISNSSGWRTYARAVASLGVQANISTTDILSGKLALPSLHEQRAIATALSDVDALIAGLEKLIAKKRDLKQATMQQLLTGQTRLPGFSGAWSVRGLGDISEIEMGQSPSSVNYNSKGQGLPLIQGNADIRDRQTIKRVFTTQITKQGKLGDVLLSVRAPVGEVARATFDFCIGRGVCVVRTSNDFIYHALIYLEPSWERFSKGSTFDSVNSTDVAAVQIAVPNDFSEQVAIAAALSDIDAELSALEFRFKKTLDLKQGLMQELLTGRTRLV